MYSDDLPNAIRRDTEYLYTTATGVSLARWSVIAARLLDAADILEEQAKEINRLRNLYEPTDAC
jgi:hypothetical protein